MTPLCCKPDFGERSRTAARQGTIVCGMIGKDGSKLGQIGAVASSGMQQPTMEEQHVALIQFGRDLSLQNALVHGRLGTKKQVAIVLVRAKLAEMRTRHQP